MTDTSGRHPAIDRPLHSRPGQTMALAAPTKRAHPQPADLKTKGAQRRGVHWHAVVADVSADDAAQPQALLADGPVQASPQFGFHRPQLRKQPLANRLPQHREASIAPLLPANVREAEKVERLRVPETTSSPVGGRVRTEFQQTSLLGMHLQMEAPNSRKRMSHPWSMVSKNARMSTSSTQFTLFVSNPTASASNA